MIIFLAEVIARADLETCAHLLVNLGLGTALLCCSTTIAGYLLQDQENRGEHRVKRTRKQEHTVGGACDK